MLKKTIKRRTVGNYPMGGWGNGYVGVPIGHPWYGVDFDQIVEGKGIHGGLLFSGPHEPIGDGHYLPSTHWWVGFETSHYGDTVHNWDKGRVDSETQKLLNMAKGVAQ